MTRIPGRPRPRTPGWVIVGNEFLARRRLNNIELGNIHGVQAFRSRIADLRRMGWPISEGKYVRRGIYVYALEPGWQPPHDWRERNPPITPTSDIAGAAAAAFEEQPGQLFDAPPPVGEHGPYDID